MDTTKLSSKGQIVIPKSVREELHWEAGLELTLIATGDGVFLKPKAPFSPTVLADVAGSLRGKAGPKSDAEIAAALDRDITEKWRGRG